MTTAVPTNRLRVDEVRVFDTPDNLTQDLQKVLVDLIELHPQGKQAHWNLVGTNFKTRTCNSMTSLTRRAKPVTRSPNACAPYSYDTPLAVMRTLCLPHN
jgi:hypothetical protein